jgi:hypothetical protein
MKPEEGYMAKPIRSEPALSLDRRQLLTSAAAIAATGIVPSYEQVEAVNPAELGGAAEIPTWNVCAVTARRIEEIAKRNRIRQENGLPLLSIAKELRRMKTAEEEAKFEAFSAIHRESVWDEALSRSARGEGNRTGNHRGLWKGWHFNRRSTESFMNGSKLALLPTRHSL